jgi:hypothetical protein
MQSEESAMEQGKVGLVMGHFSPAPTSPTLCNDRADSTDNAEKAPVQHTKQMIPKWTWPWRQKEKYSTPIVTRRLNDYPKGYPNVAAFLNSDEGFSIYRRFGYLQSRLLLSKQDDLRCSEQKLQEMEAAMIGENKDRLCYRKIVGTDVNAHRELLEDIERKFCSYCKPLYHLFLQHFSDLHSKCPHCSPAADVLGQAERSRTRKRRTIHKESALSDRRGGNLDLRS